MSLEECKQSRSSTKKNISRIKTIIDANGKGEGKTLTPTDLKCRLGILESYFKQILTYQTQIEKLDPTDEVRGDLEELYISIKTAIHSQLGDESHNTTISDTTFAFPAPSSKLPSLKLPSFDGKYSNYKNFITLYKQIVDRETCLSNIEKFNHLRNCLQGPALETVKAFQVTSENYPKALERLKSRYDNNTLIFMENITTLFQINSVSKPTGGELRSLVDNVAALYSSLSSLGSDTDIVNAMLIYLVMEKVDEETQRKWKDSLDFTKLPTWTDCCRVLERRCQFLESIDTSHSHPTESRRHDHNNFNNKNKKAVQRQGYSFLGTNRTCVICSTTDHVISACPRFKSMEVAERFERVKRLGLCLNCLAKNHQVTNCPSTFKCKVCARSHHTLLHRTKSHTPASPPSPPSSLPASSHAACTDIVAAAVHTHLCKSSMDQIILATAIVLVRDAAGCYQVGRALLDSCSQVNFVTEEFAQKLRLPREKQSMQILSIGNSQTSIKHKASTSIKSRYTNLELSLSFCITSHISYQPESEIDISSWNLPANTQLADEQFFKSKRIDLLLGTESFFEVLSVGQIKLGDNMPTLQKTLLGWIVSGRYKTSLSMLPQPICLLSYEDAVDKQLEKLWTLDEIETSSNRWTDEHTSCESFYQRTVSRNLQGRVVVRLPFKGPCLALGCSHSTALRRFNSLERRLARDRIIKSQYVAFMKEYEDLGHMSVVEAPNINQPHYYIPHHCVLKPTSTSTKLRVVFDASCQTTSQKSLNDVIMVGPTIQQELYTLFIRFRLCLYAITADIVKMYRQDLVEPNDCRFQYVLWRNSEEEPIRTYKLNTVTYGTASAPYLAVRSLHFLADQYASEFQLGAEIIKTSFYVDDLLGGADNLDELAKIKNEVSEILKRGCMELAKWHSNHKDFRDDKTVKDLNLDDDYVTNTLGITWDQNKDILIFSFNPKDLHNGKYTKRTILSLASSLFDPLGLLAPLIIVAKIILQELWLLKLNWDESIPQNLQTAWEKFLSDLTLLPSLKIPRYCLAANALSVQLHGFCDSSIRAYGCCLYLRVTDSHNNIAVQLLTAKSRVAPTKKKSLPKLELCGAQLLAQLYDKLKPSLCKYTTQAYLWTDSQIVLHWLKQHSSTLSTFVGNRICEIQDLTAVCHWRHVPTSSNPADIVSRGSTVAELVSSIWFTGPSFLLRDQEYWPENKIDKLDVEEINKEKRKSAFHTTVKPNYIVDTIKKYSTYLKIVRIIAWLFRFYRNINKTNPDFLSRSLSPQELDNALLCIVWNLQQHHFAEDIRRVAKRVDLHSPLKFLNPFLQHTGGFNLLKVGGRLELANITDEQKHPILLPRNSLLVVS